MNKSWLISLPSSKVTGKGRNIKKNSCNDAIKAIGRWRIISIFKTFLKYNHVAINVTAHPTPLAHDGNITISKIVQLISMAHNADFITFMFDTFFTIFIFKFS